MKWLQSASKAYSLNTHGGKRSSVENLDAIDIPEEFEGICKNYF